MRYDSLFFVRSPFQLLNAIEMKKDLSINNCHLIVECDSTKRIENFNQIKKLIILDEWKSITILEPSKKIAFNIKILFLLNKIRNIEYEYLVFGQFTNTLSHLFIRYSKAKKVVLVDDGAATIVIVNEYLSKSIFFYKSPYFLDRIRFYVLDTLSFNRNKLNDLFLYSVFSFPFVKNLRKKNGIINKQVDNNCIFYFGSKFVESNVVDINDEIVFLSNVYKHLKIENPKANICYLPHRDENKEKLLFVQKIGFILKVIGCPSEVYFKENKIIPVSIASCYSTVLCTLPLSYKFTNVYIYDIRPYLKCEVKEKEASDVINYLSERGFKIIKI